MARNSDPPGDMQAAFPNIPLSKKKRGEWAGPCPFCRQGTDRFVVWEKGNYWCRMCDTKGFWTSGGSTNSATTTAKTAPEPQYDAYEWAVAQWHHETLLEQPDLIAWLMQHYAISAEVIEAARLGYDVVPRSRDRINKRLLIPIPTADDLRVSGFKARLWRDVEPLPYNARYHKNRQRLPDGRVVADKWLTSAGTTPVLYGRHSIRSGEPYVHVGEGELKALALHSAGFAAGTSPNGSGHFDPDWCVWIATRGASAVYLWYDNDDAGRKGAAKAARMFAQHTPDLPMYLVPWLDTDDAKADVNDLLRPLDPADRPAFVAARLAAARPAISTTTPTTPAPTMLAGRRQQVRVPAPAPSVQQFTDIDAIRDGIRAEIIGYAVQDTADDVLLLAPWPGTGKTTEIVGVLEQLEKTVFYGAPRRNLWYTVQDASERAATFYGDAELSRAHEWKNLRGRSATDEYGAANCHYADAAKHAQSQRRDVMELLCKSACGMWGECEYSKSLMDHRAPLVFGRHQHIVVSQMHRSHDVTVIDESPLRAMVDTVTVAFEHLSITPDALRLVEALRLVCATIDDGAALDGAHILPRLDAVLTERGSSLYGTLAMINRDDPVLFGEPDNLTPSQILRMTGVKWFPEFFDILSHEAGLWFSERKAWNSRLLLRRGAVEYTVIRTPQRGQKPLILADATGTPGLYEKLLGRPVKTFRPVPQQRAEVLQLSNRMNGKAALAVQSDPAWQQTALAVQHFCSDPARRTLIIGHKAHLDRLQDMQLGEHVQYAHYGGVVGSNSWADCDQVLLVGAYMPPRDVVIRKARAIWWDDPEPISDAWTDEVRAYDAEPDADGMVPAIAVSVPVDARAKLVLEQEREAEMVQALERIRTLIGDAQKRVVILTALPLPGIRVTSFFDAQQFSERRSAMRQYITTALHQHGEVRFDAIDNAFAAWSHGAIAEHRAAVIAELSLDVATVTVARQAGERGRPVTVIHKM